MITSSIFVLVGLVFQAEAKPSVLEVADARVVMPAAPRERAQQIPSALGPIEQHLHAAQQGKAVFPFCYWDMPAKASAVDPEKLMDQGMDGQIKRVKGRLLAKKDVRLGKVGGKEFEYSAVWGDEPGFGRSRKFLVGLRMYDVTVMGPKDLVYGKAADSFLNSLELTKVPPAAKKPISFADAGFKVAMPGDPKAETLEEAGKNGPITTHLFSVEEPGLNYAAGYTDLPESRKNDSPESCFAGYIDGVTNHDRKAVSARRDIKFGAHPGKEYEYTLSLPDGRALFVRTRLYLVKSRLYQVSASGTKEKVKSKAADTFIRSFELTRKPGG